MAVEVILRDDVPNLGKIGDVVRVKPGYARNFLYPRGLAVEANRRSLRMLDHHRRVIASKAERERKSAEAVAGRLAGLVLTVRAKAGEEGRLFGSVTTIDLERALAEKGFQVERRRIGLGEPIKQLGVHAVDIQVGRDVRTTIEVRVEPE
jgi:large subunit ribosomal protein L9